MKIIFIILFLLMAIVPFVLINNSHAETGENGSVYYYVPGWDYPGCGTVSETYGHTVEEVARKEIEKQNKITNCKNCLSPAILVSVDEEAGTYVEKSVCSGASYTYQVTQITLPLPFKQESNLGPKPCHK